MNRADIKLDVNLKRLLGSNALSAAEFSRRTGIAKSVVGNWLSGSKPADIAKLKVAADFFGVSIEKLCFAKELLATVVENSLTSGSGQDHLYSGRLVLADTGQTFDIVVSGKAT